MRQYRDRFFIQYCLMNVIVSYFIFYFFDISIAWPDSGFKIFFDGKIIIELNNTLFATKMSRHKDSYIAGHIVSLIQLFFLHFFDNHQVCV